MLGKKLKDAMTNAGLSQKDLAKLINTNQSLISRWILGERNPSAKKLKKISEVLNLPVSFFLDKTFSIKKDSYENLKSEVLSLKKRVAFLEDKIKNLEKNKMK